MGFGPPGSNGSTNVSLISSDAYPGFSSFSEAGEGSEVEGVTRLLKGLAPEGSGKARRLPLALAAAAGQLQPPACHPAATGLQPTGADGA